MNSWWEANENALPIKFQAYHRHEIEELSGNLPLLLNIIRTIQIVENDENITSGDEPTSPRRKKFLEDQIFGEFLDRIWASEEIKSMISNVFEFATMQSSLLKNSDEVLMYATTAL